MFIRAICIALFSICCVSSVSADVCGAWVTAWNKGYFTSQEADRTVADAKAIGITDLFIQVRKNSDAYYNSTLEPKADNIKKDYDPLAYIIDKAHKEGIKVHAWVNTCRVWTTEPKPADKNHLVNSRTDWLTKTDKGKILASEGLYLDPGVPEARRHVVNVIKEITSNYDIDGVHLDYIRYPGKEWGYADKALKEYYTKTGSSKKPAPGDTDWVKWRAEQVTFFVKEIRSAVKSAKPNIPLSTATIAWGDCGSDFYKSAPYAQGYQDWKYWMENDLIDIHIPMNYRDDRKTAAASSFRGWLDGYCRWKSDKHVYVGIASYLNNPKSVASQINAVKERNLEGYVLFSFNESAERTALVSELKNNINIFIDESSISEKTLDKGIRLFDANQIGLAKVEFKKVINLDADLAVAYVYLGKCALKENNRLEAKYYFEKALELDSAYLEAHALLSEVS